MFLFVLSVLFLQPISITSNQDNQLVISTNNTFAVHEEGHTGEDEGAVAPRDTPPASSNVRIENRNISITGCSLWDLSSWIPCFMQSIYNLSSQALAVVGQAFNMALAFTLDQGCSGEGDAERCTVLASSQLYNAWNNIKDLANIAFILGLLYISMSLITGWQSSQAKSTFIKIILVAIVINFSLFGTKVMIDAGNITAKMFYDQLVITDTGTARTYDTGGAGGLFFSDNAQIKDISGAVMSKFNPTRIFSETSFNSFVTSIGGTEKWGVVMALLFAFTVMNVVIGVSFVIASLTFISRTVWLVLLSIVSPLAFVSTFLPFGQGLFKRWFSMLVDRCFCVVVYLFFIWLLIIVSGSFVSTGTPGSISGQNWQEILLLVVVQFIAVYTIIKIATDQTKKMCEGGMGVGSFAAGSLDKLPGLVAGGILGAPALVARSTIGGAAYNLSQGRGIMGGKSNFIGKGLEDAAANGSVSAMWARSVLKDIGNSTFGTNTGYGQKQDARSKKWQETVNEMENLRRERAKDDLRDAFVENAVDPKTGKRKFDAEHRRIQENYIQQEMKDKKISEEAARVAFEQNKKDILAKGYLGTRQAEKDLKSAAKTAQTEATTMIEKQATGVGGVMDFVIGRGVAAAGETARRRKEQIETDADTEIAKRAKARETTENRSNLELGKSEVDKEGARAIARVQELLADGASDEEIKTALQPISEALLDPKKGFLRDVSQEVRDQLESIHNDTLADIKQIRDEHQTRRATAEDRIKKAREDSQTTISGAQTTLAKIDSDQQKLKELKDRIASGAQVDLDNDTKGLLEAYGVSTQDISALDDTLISKAASNAGIKRQETQNTEAEARKTIQTLEKRYEDGVKEAEKELKSGIKEAIQNRNRALKGRFDAMIAEGQASLLTTQERIEASGAVIEEGTRNVEAQQSSRTPDFR